MGGAARLITMFEDLKGAARRTLSSMGNIDESLDREERTDADFRVHNPQFNGPTSKTLNADVRSNNKRMREAYANAQKSDGQLDADLYSEATTEQLKVVAKSREELLRMFPSSAAALNLLDFDETLDKKPGDSAEVVQLEAKLQELADLIDARTKSTAALKAIVSVDLNEVTSNAMSAGQDINASHAHNIKLANETQMTVNAGISKQNELLREIMTLNDAFVKERQTNAAAIERNAVIQKIEESVAKFSLIHSQITAGVTFYSSLQVRFSTFRFCTFLFFLPGGFIVLDAHNTVKADNPATNQRRRGLHAAVAAPGLRGPVRG
jgi:hypothetical protein